MSNSAVTHEACPLPLKPDDITAEWLTRALVVRHPGVTVTEASVEEVYHGATSIYRARVAYDEAGDAAGLPPTLIVKGGFEAHSPMMKDIALAEAHFYGDVVPQITINTPRIFFTGSDPDSYQSIMIMEDLVARDVTWLDGLRPMGFEDTAARLRAMAVYHAQTWDSPKFAPGGDWEWLDGRFGPWLMAYAEGNLDPEVWETKLASAQGTVSSVRLHDRDWMRGALLKLKERDESGPVCLIHGDSHLSNLFLDVDGTPGFYDPAACKAHWSIEVAYTIGSHLDLADRRAWEAPLLAIYLEALAAAGAPAPTFEQAQHDYACSLAYGYFMFTINDIHFRPSAFNAAGAARFAAAAIDNDTIGRLG